MLWITVDLIMILWNEIIDIKTYKWYYKLKQIYAINLNCLIKQLDSVCLWLSVQIQRFLKLSLLKLKCYYLLISITSINQSIYIIVWE